VRAGSGHRGRFLPVSDRKQELVNSWPKMSSLRLDILKPCATLTISDNFGGPVKVGRRDQYATVEVSPNTEDPTRAIPAGKAQDGRPDLTLGFALCRAGAIAKYLVLNIARSIAYAPGHEHFDEVGARRNITTELLRSSTDPKSVQR